MSDPIDVHEAKTQLSRLLDRAHAGEQVVLYKAGKPCAKLVPLERTKRRLVFIEGHLDDALFEPLPAAELDAWAGQ